MAPRAKPNTSDTRTRLLEAAMSEFIEQGYAGTDTNRIARRAGFAPQTFYRWFEDKKAILSAVLGVWLETECRSWQAVLLDQTLPIEQLADACVDNARPFLTFRQHLRSVLLTDETLRLQQAQARRQLIDQLAPADAPDAQRATMAALLSQIDALTELLARDDIALMGLSDAPARADLGQLILRLRQCCITPSAE